MGERHERALDVAIATAREAGALLLAEQRREGGPRGEKGKAEADERAQALIRDRLLAAVPWRFRAEERDEVVETGDPAHVWLVDPNDGTASFLKGRRGPAVSIAGLREGVPILGVVFAYSFPDDRGDLIAWAEGCALTRNGRPLDVDLGRDRLVAGATVFVSQHGDERAPENARCVAPARYFPMPSIAYRLALVAAGEGVAGVSLHSPHGWDYAAGHALLRGAKGDLVDETGAPVRYGPTGESRVKRCFGGGTTVVLELAKRPWELVLASRDPATPRSPRARLSKGSAVTDPGVLSRAQGCLLGQLAGDALGALVEFRSRETIASHYPRGVRDLADGGTFDTLAGQPTDDSELALSLARSLVDEKRFEAGAVLDAYVAWLDSFPFDIGHTTSTALEAARRGTTRAERLRRCCETAIASSQANGSLMRASPLGIFGHADPARAAAWARDDSALTHPHSACREACASFVAAIATAVGRGGDAAAAHEAALGEAERGGHRAVIRALRDAERAPPSDFMKQSGWVLIALQNAFFRLLHGQDVEESLVATVGEGGDTDTNAAIAGALLGAVHGRDAIPARWRRSVLTCRALEEVGARHPRPQRLWGVDALELAELLVLAGRAAAPGGYPAAS